MKAITEKFKLKIMFLLNYLANYNKNVLRFLKLKQSAILLNFSGSFVRVDRPSLTVL